MLLDFNLRDPKHQRVKLIPEARLSPQKKENKLFLIILLVLPQTTKALEWII